GRSDFATIGPDFAWHDFEAEPGPGSGAALPSGSLSGRGGSFRLVRLASVSGWGPSLSLRRTIPGLELHLPPPLPSPAIPRRPPRGSRGGRGAPRPRRAPRGGGGGAPRGGAGSPAGPGPPRPADRRGGPAPGR